MNNKEKLNYCRTVLQNNPLSQTFYLQILGLADWNGGKSSHGIDKATWEMALESCQSIMVLSPSILTKYKPVV